MGFSNLSKLLLGAGLFYSANFLYRLGKIEYLDDQLTEAEQKFERRWDNPQYNSCACELVRDINIFTQQIEEEKEEQNNLMLNPWHGLYGGK